MPQHLSPAWVESLGPNAEEIHTTWLHRLANLTLTGYNPSLSNNPFTEKRDAEKYGYKASGLRMNQKIAQKESWGLPELEERNAELISYAKTIWSLPATKFVPAEKEFDSCTLDDENIESIIAKGFHYLKENYSDAKVQRNIIEMIINFARGDARAALNLVEDLFFASDIKDGVRILTAKRLEELAQTTLIKYSQNDHYDMASAFQKSLRGSDRNAAIYWLAKMITAGEDPRFIARRLIVCASEDVGNADPNALTVAMNAHRAAELLGMPEARIPLAQAVEYVASAPKSNRAICAIDEAIADIMAGKNYPPPMHLRDSHYKDASKYGFGKGYVYTHDNPDFEQQFMPDELKDKKYFKD